MKFMKIPAIYTLVYAISSIIFILLLVVGRLPIGSRSSVLPVLFFTFNGIGIIFEIVCLVFNRKKVGERRLGILLLLIYLIEISIWTVFIAAFRGPLDMDFSTLEFMFYLMICSVPVTRGVLLILSIIRFRKITAGNRGL